MTRAGSGMRQMNLGRELSTLYDTVVATPLSVKMYSENAIPSLRVDLIIYCGSGNVVL